MYLSRLKLEPFRLRKVYSSPQAMHGAIEAAFEGELDARKLWRIDRLDGQDFLLVCSPALPLDSVPNDLGGKSVTWESLDYEPFLSKLEVGQRWHFRLRANPTYSVSQGEGKRGKVYAHVTTEQQKLWLLSRAEKYGFVIAQSENDVDVEQDDEGAGTRADLYQFDVAERMQLRFQKKAGTKPVEVRVATLEGVLEVTDAGALRHALCGGIGRAKAYGCGLMTLAVASRR